MYSSKDIQIKGYLIHTIILINMVLMVASEIILPDVIPLVPSIYYVSYLVFTEGLLWYACYKTLKTDILGKTLLIIMMSVLMILSYRSLDIVKISLLFYESNNNEDYTTKCLQVTDVKIRSRYSSEHTAHLKTPDYFGFSNSYEINKDQKKYIDLFSHCSCIELKVFKSPVGFYYIRNNDKGKVKNCE